MAPFALAMLALVAAVLGRAATGEARPPRAAALPCPLRAHAVTDLQLTGYLGDLPVRVWLRATGDGPTRSVTGAFYDTDAWQKKGDSADASLFTVTGGLSDRCALTLAEHDAIDDQTGAWEAYFAGPGHLRGSRRNLEADRSESIALRIVPALTCDGAGRWRTHVPPHGRWRFSYPGAWRVTDEDGVTTLDCPDPSVLAHGGISLRVASGPAKIVVTSLGPGGTPRPVSDAAILALIRRVSASARPVRRR
jgi:hypothetical protein